MNEMAKPKPAYCKNCGEGIECKTFDKTGKACRKGKAIGKAKGKAVGKANGKAISEKTQAKRTECDEKLGNLRTDYLNAMRNKQIRNTFKLVDEFTGEVTVLEKPFKLMSFERYLQQIGEKKLASFMRYNYKSLQQFNFKDFNESDSVETLGIYYFDKFIEKREKEMKVPTYEEKLNDLEKAKRELSKLLEYNQKLADFTGEDIYSWK